MKIAIVNDTHFGTRSDSAVFLDHQERFFSEIFFPEIDKQSIKTVIDLGDTFDRRKFINFVTLDRVRKFFFDELAKRNIEYHAIVGNHSGAWRVRRTWFSLAVKCTRQDYRRPPGIGASPTQLSLISRR